MRIRTFWRNGCALFLAILMSHAPAVAAADKGLSELNQTRGQMIATGVLVADMTRTQAEEKVRDVLAKDEVKKALIERGISPSEISSRLASLSDQELRQLAGQMDQARYGGDILVAILIVVLIIFLVKRI